METKLILTFGSSQSRYAQTKSSSAQTIDVSQQLRVCGYGFTAATRVDREGALLIFANCNRVSESQRERIERRDDLQTKMMRKAITELYSLNLLYPLVF